MSNLDNLYSKRIGYKLWFGNFAQEEDVNPMKKHWTFYFGGVSKTYDTKEAAEEAAKRGLKSHSTAGYDKATIYESVSFIETPVPDYKVTPITA